jgi:hypothetical protein
MNTVTALTSVDFSEDEHLSPAVKVFLTPLNAGGPPLESLPREDARNVLVNAQASAAVDLSASRSRKRRFFRMVTKSYSTL